MAQEPLLAAHLNEDWLAEMQDQAWAAKLQLHRRYRESKQQGTPYAQAVDFIRAQQL